MDQEISTNNSVEEITTDVVVVKNKGGRPKGKRDSHKRYSPYIKAQAQALYIAGHDLDDICSALNIKVKSTLVEWAKKENWGEERDRVLASSTREMMADVMKNMKENFEGLRLLKDTSLSEIRKEDGLRPQRFSESANAYMSALELEYRLKSEALQVNFINDIAVVLRKKIQDRQLLAEIADELREVFDRHRQRKLPEPKAESNASS